MKPKVIVCCLGYCFQVYLELLTRKYEIIGLADNDRAKWGSYCGYECFSVADAVARKPEQFIVATRNWNIVHTIEAQVKTMDPDMRVISLKEAVGSTCCFSESTYEPNYVDECGNACILAGQLVFGKIEISFEGSNNTVHIKKGVRIDSDIRCLVFGDDNYLEIGEGTTIGSLYAILAEHGRVTIGRDCMLSGGIEINQSAFHPIFDKKTGKRLNISRDVRIGNHVWIGAHAGLMSGFEIGDGSVVGYGSITSGHFGEEVVIAGSPARVIREGIQWERDVVGTYELDHISSSLEHTDTFGG